MVWTLYPRWSNIRSGYDGDVSHARLVDDRVVRDVSQPAAPSFEEGYDAQALCPLRTEPPNFEAGGRTAQTIAVQALVMEGERLFGCGIVGFKRCGRHQSSIGGMSLGR